MNPDPTPISSSNLAKGLAHPEHRPWLVSAALVFVVLAMGAAILVAAGGHDRFATVKTAPDMGRIAGIERLAGGNPPVLRASGLIIVDEQGVERIVMEIDEKGTATIKLNDAAGKMQFQAP